MKLREGFHIPGDCSTDARNKAAEEALENKSKMQKTEKKKNASL
jgi:hypothetical protein